MIEIFPNQILPVSGRFKYASLVCRKDGVQEVNFTLLIDSRHVLQDDNKMLNPELT